MRCIALLFQSPRLVAAVAGVKYQQASAMKPVRYVVGAIGFLLVWFVVAVVVGLGMAMLFPPSGGRFMAGIGLDWRNLPGTVLGLFAGARSFRASVGAERRRTRSEQRDT